jgi:hypothetical protein
MPGKIRLGAFVAEIYANMLGFLCIFHNSPSGKFQDKPGNATCTSCSCKKGQYSQSEQSAKMQSSCTCHNCADGKYMAENNCYACPAGRFTATDDSVGCWLCPAGERSLSM